MKVHEIMTRNPTSIQLDAPLKEAVHHMRDRKCRHLPVLQRAEVVGIVSDRELRSYVSPIDVTEIDLSVIQNRLSEPVSQITQHELISVGPDDSLQDAILLMLENDVGALPVIEPPENTLVGMLSYVDVLRACTGEGL